MRPLTCEINPSRNLRCVQMKPQPRSALNDLKKNFPDKETMNKYMQVLMSAPSHVTDDIILNKLDRICSQYRTTNKVIVSWSTVELLNCEGVADEHICLALKYLIMPETFEPFNFKRSGSEDNGARGSLALDNLLSANRVSRLQEKLNLLFTCQKIRIRVIEGLPKYTLNAEIKSELIAAAKDALNSSYDATTRALNLSRFHAKPELAAHFCPLHVDIFLKCILNLILQQTPHVSKIILSDNYLCSLKAFSVIPNGLLAGLECLDISSNNIRELADLQFLANLSLKNLILKGNGMAKLKLDEIQTILPRLQNVQGCFPTQYKEKVTIALPNLKPFDSIEPCVQLYAKNFVKHFYQFFDHPKLRSQLEQHYHKEATFSLSVPETMKQVSAYRLYNRNYKTTQSKFARSAKLQVGVNAVVHALGRLPKMETDLPDRNINVQMLTSHMRLVTMTGQFMEHSPTGRNLRYFQRNFVLEQQGSSGVWLIKNDMFCIIPSIKEHTMDERLQSDELQCVNTLEMAVEKMSINVTSPPMPITPERLSVDTVLKEIEEVPITAPEINDLAAMPRLVPIPLPESQIEVTQQADKNNLSNLEQEIDDTLLSDDSDELVINEDVLFADCDL